MRRFEFEEGGSAKFWQIAVDGTELTVTFGRSGTAGQTKTKSFETAAAAEKEAAKLVREKTGKGYVEQRATEAAPSASPAPAAPSPAPADAVDETPASKADKPAKTAKTAAPTELFGITARKFQGAVAKLASVKYPSDVSDVLRRAGVAPRDTAAAIWHIAATGPAPVGTMLFGALDDAYVEDLAFDAIEAVARRIGERPSGHDGKNWLAYAIKFAQRAHRLDAARAAALGASLPDPLRAAFLVVKDSPPTEDELALVFRQLSGSSGAFAVENVRGLLEGFLVHAPLARLEWVLGDDFLGMRVELPRLLAARRDTAEELFALAERLRARPVRPQNQGLERAFEAAALAVAMHRLAERGEPIPAGLEAKVPFGGDLQSESRTFNATVSMPALALGVAALPVDRALALVGDDLVQSLVVLAVVPEPERLLATLRRLELGMPPRGSAFHHPAHALSILAGADPVRMLRALRGLLATSSDADRALVRIAACTVLGAEASAELDRQGRSRGAYVAKLGLEGERAEDAAALVTTASAIASPDAWSASGVESILGRLPADLRGPAALRMLAEGEAIDRLLLLASYLPDAVLAELLAAALASPERVAWKEVARVSGHARVKKLIPAAVADHVREVGPIAAEASVAFGITPPPPEETPLEKLVRWSKEHATGPTQRLYAVNRRRGVATGSRVEGSRVEGPGPAIDRAAHAIPEDAVHALTLDLAEIPELAARFPGARLVSVYAPDPARGEWDDGWVVASPALPDAPAGGETPASPLVLTPIDVPAAPTAAEKSELRKLLLAQHGWALGAPSWIQDPVGGDEGFVMQFGGRLGRDFGTADNGEVYVFEDGVFLPSD